MDVELPDGTLVTDVPDNITKAELMARLGKSNIPTTEQPPSGFLNDAAKKITLGAQSVAAGAIGAIPDLALSGLQALERLSPGEEDVVGATRPVSRAQMNLPPELREGGIKPVPENQPFVPSVTNTAANLLGEVTGETANTPFEKAIKTGGEYFGGGVAFGGGASPSNMLSAMGGGAGTYSDNPMMSPMLALAGGMTPMGLTVGREVLHKVGNWLSPTSGVANKIKDFGYDPNIAASEVGGEIKQSMDDMFNQTRKGLGVTGVPYSAPTTTAQMGVVAQNPLKNEAAALEAQNQTRVEQLQSANQTAVKPFVAPYGSTPERAGIGISTKIEESRKSLEPLRQEIVGAIGDRPANLADDVTSSIRRKFNPSKLDDAALIAFDEDVSAIRARNAASGSVKGGINEEEFNTLMGQYKNDPKMQMIIKNQFGGTVQENAGFLTYDDLTELADKYFGKDLTSKLLYGRIKEAQKTLANESGIGKQFDAYNAKYHRIMELKRDYISGKESSQTFNSLYKQATENPTAFNKEIQAVPSGERQEFFKMTHREMGGGNNFSEAKWAENFNKLSPDSQMALAGQNPRAFTQMRKAADNILANQVDLQKIQKVASDSFAALGADEAGIKLIKMAQQQPSAFSALVSKSDEAGRRIIADGVHSSLGARGDAFDINQWAEGFKKLPSTTKLTLAGNQQKLAELTNMADDVLSKAQQLSQATDKLGQFNKIGKQPAADKMVAMIQREPDLYRQYMKILPEKTQRKVISLAHKELGGGNTFDIETWGKNVKNLDPESLLVMAWDDPKVAEQLTTVANEAHHTGAVARNIRSVLVTAGFGISHTVGYPVLIMSRLLANRSGVATLSGLARIGGKNFPRAKGVLANQLKNIMMEMQSEDKADGIPQDSNFTPDALPGVAPEGGFTPPPFEQKQEASYLDKLKQVENAGKDTADKNPVSSATGPFQIVDSTWSNLQRDYPQFRGKDKNDPSVQEEATLVLQKESDDSIVAAGLTPDDNTRSFVHFLGETNARKLLKKLDSKIPAARLAPAAAKSNPEYFYEKLPNGRKRARTPREVFDYRVKKMSKAESEYQTARK